MCGISAINLTKTSFNAEVAKDVLLGLYQFIYLVGGVLGLRYWMLYPQELTTCCKQSPEIFLNNGLFDELYYSQAFRDRLILRVIDEGHMIYCWGLVESRHSKKSAAFKKTQDQGCFRPSYGHLGTRLLPTDDVPSLMMSATCRPIAIQAIMVSLKLTENNLNILRGELTRPEIRFIRVYMDCPLASAQDLLRIIPHASDVSHSQYPQALVYSGTQNHTLTVLKILHKARGTPQGAKNGLSSFARRFHAATGPIDKLSRINDFASGLFLVLACTLALGMGQNWSCVREVIIMGRADPSNLIQMGGRCGRDGRPGLVFLFMERTRPRGKNELRDFVLGAVQSDDDRMDALALTPVCLRVAFNVDNT